MEAGKKREGFLSLLLAQMRDRQEDACMGCEIVTLGSRNRPDFAGRRASE
jgi:hypothetical protein